MQCHHLPRCTVESLHPAPFCSGRSRRLPPLTLLAVPFPGCPDVAVVACATSRRVTHLTLDRFRALSGPAVCARGRRRLRVGTIADPRAPGHHSPQLPSRLPSTHTHVERTRCRASRWSAPLYERPGRPVPCLLGLSWVDGRRDGSSPPQPSTGRHPRTAPRPSRSQSAPAGGMSVTEGTGGP